ncbi:MAG: hypothetical protein ACE5FF_17950, partial [Saprospiraceae bacterium]
MKKALLFPLFFSFTFLAFGQQFLHRSYRDLNPAPARVQPSPGGDVIPGVVGVPPSPLGFRALEKYIGQTRFDLQTVNSLGR